MINKSNILWGLGLGLYIAALIKLIGDVKTISWWTAIILGIVFMCVAAITGHKK